MAEKRLLLERADSPETEKLEVQMTRRKSILQVIQHRHLPVSCRVFALRRKSVLALVVAFVFFYFLIGRPDWVNVLDLDALHADNFLTVHHQSTAVDGRSFKDNPLHASFYIFCVLYFVYCFVFVFVLGVR